MSETRKGWLQLLLVAVFIIGSVSFSRMLQSREPTPGINGAADRTLFVTTQRVTPAPYRIAFTTTGVLEARTEIAVVPEVSGRVVSVSDDFFEGGGFAKDQLLFQIAPEDYELQVRRLEAEVARARTAYNLEQAEAEAATLEWRQVNGSKPIPDLVARRPQLDEAEASLQAARAQLQDAKLDLRRTRFTLPFNGRVLSSRMAAGQYVIAGQSFGTVFDSTTLEVRASLEDSQLQWLLGADDTDISVTATFLGQTRDYAAVLQRGAAALDSQTRFATVSFALTDNVEDLLPGLFVEIRIRGPELTGITRLPIAALQENGTIWQVDAEGRLLATDAEVVYVNDDHIAVRGIAPTTDIVVSRLAGAAAGMRVVTQTAAARAEP